MVLTRANIAYNLYKTPHILAVSYKDKQTVIYYFSSELYMNKFMSRREEHYKTIKSSLSNRFGFTIECELISDLRLYSSIEKRGFLISVDGEYKQCQKDITLDGLKMIARTYQEL